MKYGVDAIMAPFTASPDLVTAVKMTEDKLGRGFIMIDTMFLDITDSEDGRRNARAVIKDSAVRGTKIFAIHHYCVRNLINGLKGKIERIGDYTVMIREFGMIPAVGSHIPEVVNLIDENEYDFESYIQIYNCDGFLMQQEIEKCARTIQNAKKPVMTIKPMASGRLTPYVGLTWAWNTLRPQDMVTVGAFTAAEAEEDIRISFSALDHRFPDLPFEL